ncbi:MAG: substrate-binding domain-containing protein [Desulfobulbaceae bacterium]|nr:substrate-binding domain-containing protein [Desulfobulbaceae bacterium]
MPEMLNCGGIMNNRNKHFCKNIKIFAAGSLKSPLRQIVDEYSQVSNVSVDLELGPSGILKNRIMAGERADLFLSANHAHARELMVHGRTGEVIAFATNELCLFGRFAPCGDDEQLLAVMLDETLRLATSTPGDDPGGDYAFEVFKRADFLKPGVSAILAAKSKQLVGGKDSTAPPPGIHAVAQLFFNDETDIFLGYYTSALIVREQVGNIHIEKLPKQIACKTEYTMARLSSTSLEAEKIASFILSSRGGEILQQHGFGLP